MNLLASPAVTERYDTLLRRLALRGRGRTMGDLADAWALACALEDPEADPDTLDTLRARLGLLGTDLEAA
jgi:hypothetical protein